MLAALTEELAAVLLKVPNQIDAFHAASLRISSVRGLHKLTADQLFSNHFRAFHCLRGQSAISL